MLLVLRVLREPSVIREHRLLVVHPRLRHPLLLVRRPRRIVHPVGNLYRLLVRHHHARVSLGSLLELFPRSQICWRGFFGPSGRELDVPVLGWGPTFAGDSRGPRDWHLAPDNSAQTLHQRLCHVIQRRLHANVQHCVVEGLRDWRVWSVEGTPDSAGADLIRDNRDRRPGDCHAHSNGLLGDLEQLCELDALRLCKLNARLLVDKRHVKLHLQNVWCSFAHQLRIAP
mmetsp:Transcript_52574/g.123330  ORF Transcript_52574/g.123330 Transcript_52574/m.123330 type:complete len:228 (-) Transcript_52574:1069-1752(-)